MLQHSKINIQITQKYISPKHFEIQTFKNFYNNLPLQSVLLIKYNVFRLQLYFYPHLIFSFDSSFIHSPNPTIFNFSYLYFSKFKNIYNEIIENLMFLTLYFKTLITNHGLF